MKKEKLVKYNINTKWLLIVTIFVFFVVSLVVAYFIFKRVHSYPPPEKIKLEVENKKEDGTECTDCVRRLIDGIYVKPGEENYFPIGVIVENQVDARPQSGLSEANLVYEAEAEGWITRFLAFYADGSDIKKIGPIRSARPYFVDWAHEFSALFAHCGGSPEALVKIKKDKIYDLNEFYNEKYFWRDNTRDAPHNIYTSSEKLKKYLETENLKEGKYFSWNFKDDAEEALRPDNSEIDINFQLSNYIVKWKYNKESNDYTRYMAGEVHKDAENHEIKAKNVIIEFVGAKVIDDDLRLKMDHIGEGKAIVCLDGKCEEGKWQKKSSSARTQLYNTEGKEFQFNAGTTWVEVVRSEYRVIY